MCVVSLLTVCILSCNALFFLLLSPSTRSPPSLPPPSPSPYSGFSGTSLRWTAACSARCRTATWPLGGTTGAYGCTFRDREREKVCVSKNGALIVVCFGQRISSRVIVVVVKSFAPIPTLSLSLHVVLHLFAPTAQLLSTSLHSSPPLRYLKVVVVIIPFLFSLAAFFLKIRYPIVTEEQVVQIGSGIGSHLLKKSAKCPVSGVVYEVRQLEHHDLDESYRLNNFMGVKLAEAAYHSPDVASKTMYVRDLEHSHSHSHSQPRTHSHATCSFPLAYATHAVCCMPYPAPRNHPFLKCVCDSFRSTAP